MKDLFAGFTYPLSTTYCKTSSKLIFFLQCVDRASIIEVRMDTRGEFKHTVQYSLKGPDQSEDPTAEKSNVIELAPVFMPL